MRPRAHLWLVLLAAAVSFALGGCAPSIGDSCETAFDCSINGDRTCDLARPGGACTVYGCEADSCPDGAVCVRFRPEPSRLSFTACMRPCEGDDSCRSDDGYRCVTADQVTETPEGGEVIAALVDEQREDDGAFCIATVP